MILGGNKCNSTFGGAPCPLVCDPGYTGRTNLTCSDTGVWTGSLTCTPCPAQQYQPNAGQTSCIPWTDCVLGTSYQSTAPTTTTNRVCKACTPACNTSFAYESVPPTLTSDRVCSQLAICRNLQYISKQATATSNRVCSDCTVCGYGYTAAPGTCASTLNSECVPCQSCSFYEYRSRSCEAFSDSECSPLTICGLGYAQLVAPTASTDRECSKTATNSSVSPASDSYMFIVGSVRINGVPDPLTGSQPSPSFLSVFTNAVILSMQPYAGKVSVVIFSVKTSGARRAVADVTVSYRIDASTNQITSTSSFEAAAKNTGLLTTSLKTLGPQLSGDDYSSVSVASIQTTPKSYNNDNNNNNNNSTSASSSSSDNTNTVIGASVGVVVAIIVIVAVVVYFLRSSHSGDVDLTGDLASAQEPGTAAVHGYVFRC
jgi:hypothetical protein